MSATYDAADAGFAPGASGLVNQQALQAALDRRGTIAITRPGTYALAGTVLIGSHTELRCSPGVTLRKVDEQGPFSHVLLNRGALDGSWDEDIIIDGLHLEVAGMDLRKWMVFGLHGQLGFLRVRDICIRRFRCCDLGRLQYGIHVCTFEDLLVDDVIIHGHKDGVHLGRGRRFTIRNGVFGTSDDAIALNAHDYDVGNPELGWIEHGVIENCHDLRLNKDVGFFARILAGAWLEWRPGLEVQKSDTVVSEGRLYRVRADPDGNTFVSRTRPTHATGAAVLDGITWMMVQEDGVQTAGVRHVTFRDITLAKPRIGLSIHFDNDKYSRSYYPGAPEPLQEHLCFDGVRVLHDQPTPLLCINTPVDGVQVSRALIHGNGIHLHGAGFAAHPRSDLQLIGNTFTAPGPMDLLVNESPGRELRLTAAGNTWRHDAFAARARMGPGRLLLRGCDLPGLQP